MTDKLDYKNISFEHMFDLDFEKMVDEIVEDKVARMLGPAPPPGFEHVVPNPVNIRKKMDIHSTPFYPRYPKYYNQMPAMVPHRTQYPTNYNYQGYYMSQMIPGMMPPAMHPAMPPMMPPMMPPGMPSARPPAIPQGMPQAIPIPLPMLGQQIHTKSVERRKLKVIKPKRAIKKWDVVQFEKDSEIPLETSEIKISHKCARVFLSNKDIIKIFNIRTGCHIEVIYGSKNFKLVLRSTSKLKEYAILIIKNMINDAENGILNPQKIPKIKL